MWFMLLDLNCHDADRRAATDVTTNRLLWLEGDQNLTALAGNECRKKVATGRLRAARQPSAVCQINGS